MSSLDEDTPTDAYIFSRLAESAFPCKPFGLPADTEDPTEAAPMVLSEVSDIPLKLWGLEISMTEMIEPTDLEECLTLR